MFLENLVVDATDPRALGRFWEAVLGTDTLTDDPGGFETRLAMTDGAYLDLCFQPVPGASTEPQRLHLDIRGEVDQQEAVDRLLALGARHADIGRGSAPWEVLADPEGNTFWLWHEPADVETGPLAALHLDTADPERGLDFWSWLTGWAPAAGSRVPTLQHPSRRGPLLQLRSEAAPKGTGKNRMHLDVRLEPGDDADALVQGILDRGGRELHHDWGDLPWRCFLDPSGNEFCVLPAPSRDGSSLSPRPRSATS